MRRCGARGRRTRSPFDALRVVLENFLPARMPATQGMPKLTIAGWDQRGRRHPIETVAGGPLRTPTSCNRSSTDSVGSCGKGWDAASGTSDGTKDRRLPRQSRYEAAPRPDPLVLLYLPERLAGRPQNPCGRQAAAAPAPSRVSPFARYSTTRKKSAASGVEGGQGPEGLGSRGGRRQRSTWTPSHHQGCPRSLPSSLTSSSALGWAAR
jgi:hypothetical protein